MTARVSLGAAALDMTDRGWNCEQARRDVAKDWTISAAIHVPNLIGCDSVLETIPSGSG